ncbi:MAG: dihydrolipoamide acyltransferase, partial [Oscillospiraceae bacterium]|nr:dihydrolipoamide acyltransferase [Oscillospiraceae bacterium]
GTLVNITHGSPSPVGMEVRAVAEVIAISENGKMYDFKVTAYDAKGVIGEGTHQRAIIDVERFMAKCQSKL